MKLQILRGDEKVVAFTAGRARPGLVKQLFKGLAAQGFTKTVLVPMTPPVYALVLSKVTLKRLGVTRPTTLMVRLPLPITKNPVRPLTDLVVTLPCGSLLSRCWILVLILSVKVVSGAIRKIVVWWLRLVRVRRLVVIYIGPVLRLVRMLILSGLVTTLTLMALKIRCPVTVMQVPLGLMTPKIGGTSLALQVVVVTFRVLLIPQTLAVLVIRVVVRTQGPIELLPVGGAKMVTDGMLVMRVGTALTRIADGQVVALLGMQMLMCRTGANPVFRWMLGWKALT